MILTTSTLSTAPSSSLVPQFFDLLTALGAFLSQPWGAAGAVCIMIAVTCYNSRRLQDRLARAHFSKEGMSLLCNGLNLVGGTCLLVNAVIRDEIVWQVLEFYFIAIALKGLWQSRGSLASFWNASHSAPEEASASTFTPPAP
jgi:hypothetical protein